MNYYPHHIGDYITATAHLTMIEDGAYRRLLDLYYSTEKPLPLERKALYRLARARAREEQEAINIVLEEFFELGDDGWTHSRCDEEIAKAKEKGIDAEAKKDNERERQKRHRQRRAAMFEQLRHHGIVPAWDTSTTDLQGMVSRLPSPGSTPPVTDAEMPPVTPVTRTATAIHKPIANNQKNKAAASQLPTSQDEAENDAALPEGSINPPATPDPMHVRAVELTALLRKRGASLQASDPRLRRWAETGVTDAQALSALEVAQQRRESSGSAAAINAGYLDSILADIVSAKPQPRARGHSAVDDWYRSDAGIDRKGRELGMFAHGGESYAAFRDRIWQRIRDIENNPQEVNP